MGGLPRNSASIGLFWIKNVQHFIDIIRSNYSINLCSLLNISFYVQKKRRKMTLFVVIGSYNKSKLPMVIPSHFELEYIIRENTVLF